MPENMMMNVRTVFSETQMPLKPCIKDALCGIAAESLKIWL